MMLRIFVAFEIANLAMFLGGFATIVIKEVMHTRRTNDLYRFNRFNDYLDEHWPECRESSFMRTIVNALLLLGLRSARMLDEYYNFLDYDAEQQMKKEEG